MAEEKKIEIMDIVEKAKVKGIMSQKEMLVHATELEDDPEQLDKLYELLEAAGVEIIGYLDD